MKAGDLVKMICEIKDTDKDCLLTETRVGLYNNNKKSDPSSTFFGNKHLVYVEGELREYSEKLWRVEVLNER